LASRKRISAFRKFFGWQIGQRIVNHPMLYPLVEDSVLLVQKGMAGATGNIYTGLLEFTDMAFVLHALREEDIFGDIGANIGVYTILASKNTGAKTIAVEPIASTSKRLSQNVELNNVSGLVTLHTCGVGAIRGTLRFTSTADTVNHVVNENEMGGEGAVVEVPVIPLDEIFAGISPAILKMDIEGSEASALMGMRDLVERNPSLHIIMELNERAMRRTGHSLSQLIAELSLLGFSNGYVIEQHRDMQLEAFSGIDAIMSTGDRSPSVRAADIVLAMMRRSRHMS